MKKHLIQSHSTLPFTLPTMKISLFDIFVCQFDINSSSPKRLMYRLARCAVVSFTNKYKNEKYVAYFSNMLLASVS